MAPSDRMEGQAVVGASVQGGLVDVRFGQACVAVGNTGLLLDYSDASSFTLDGSVSSAKELAQLVLEGVPLTVAVRYDPETGLIGWLDAISSRKQSAIYMKLEPFRGPAYTTPTTIEVRVNPADLEGPGSLRIPGIARNIPLRQGKAKLPLLSGWDWNQLPIFVVDGERVLRGRKLSAVSTPLKITNVGPTRASSSLSRIPCWVEFEAPMFILDSSATRIEASGGAVVEDLVTKRGRVSFWLKAPSTGSYDITVRLSDILGRDLEEQWTVSVTTGI